VLWACPPGYGFEQAAVDAVMQWRYQPGLQAGEAIDTYMPVIFELGQPARKEER
jgi:hypothetical protein